MKIALVYPPSAETGLKGYPLGLGYLSVSLKKNNAVDIYDYNGKEFRSSIKDFLGSLKRNKPNLVGISFNSFNRWGAYQIFTRIKKIDPDIAVVLGGVHPSVMHRQLFKYFYPYIDYIIQSEGEVSLNKLAIAIESGAEYKGISGLVYKDGQGGIKINPATEITRDLDSLPMPDYSYASSYIRKKEIAFLITSRGCPANCSFCSTSSFWGQNVRMYSSERVGEEVEYVKGMGARKIFFHDDTFNLGIERTMSIAAVLKKANIEYAVSCRVTPVTEEMVAALADSGCRHICWGVESLSDKIMNSIHKGITKEQVKRAFDICAKFIDKMTTSAYFCVGIPGESEETIQESEEYLNENIRSTHGAGASILYILPGTRVYQKLVGEHKFNEKLWIKSGAVYYYTKEQSMATLNKWRKRINRSGIRLKTKLKYFWDDLPVEENKGLPLFAGVRKAGKKLHRFLNMTKGRY